LLLFGKIRHTIDRQVLHSTDPHLQTGKSSSVVIAPRLVQVLLAVARIRRSRSHLRELRFWPAVAVRG